MTTAPDVDHELAALILPFDAFDPDYYRDPYSVYRRIREESGQVFRTPGGLVTVLSHEAAATVMSDPRLGYGDDPIVADQFVPNPDGPPGRPLIFMDPPDHTRIRALVSKAFTPRMVEGLRERTAQFAAQLMRDVAARGADGPVDLMSGLAGQLPALVLDALIDVPQQYHELFLGLANVSGRGLDPGFILSSEEKRQRDEARDGFVKAGLEMAAQRRADPGADLISQLALAQADGDQLSELELGMTLMNLLAAGFNATRALIGNASLALLRHPDQFRWLREHPDQIVSATEELLRYDAPLQMVPRTALAEVEVGGILMQPGEHVAAVLGAANHDPEYYSHADTLDLSRPTGRNLGFGHGIHFCVAAPIAKLTTQAALAELVKYDVELAVDEPERFPGIVLRTLGELPATVKPV
ncbi:cytochrome P450 [Kitasatospora sp. MAA4]|uniref:cytochrome P450 n=1 Tax=Kitasatospora sp. MAA4 TaxID=3035093 RepID=UPI0024758EEB|nr:cytochrome P450 [Kitasatospora sp. MAA4]MDH6134252.1 cytochrome P450 [Kitasatospora sp. MAA4]